MRSIRAVQQHQLASEEATSHVASQRRGKRPAAVLLQRDRSARAFPASTASSLSCGAFLQGAGRPQYAACNASGSGALPLSHIAAWRCGGGQREHRGGLGGWRDRPLPPLPPPPPAHRRWTPAPTPSLPPGPGARGRRPHPCHGAEELCDAAGARCAPHAGDAQPAHALQARATGRGRWHGCLFDRPPQPGMLTTLTKPLHAPLHCCACSGMLPGYVSGFYSYDDVHIDLSRLARFSGARLVQAEACGLDTRVRAQQAGRGGYQRRRLPGGRERVWHAGAAG